MTVNHVLNVVEGSSPSWPTISSFSVVVARSDGGEEQVRYCAEDGLNAIIQLVLLLIVFLF